MDRKPVLMLCVLASGKLMQVQVDDLNKQALFLNAFNALDND
ncbi:hypothetical protein [Acinetobacter sp. NIPH 2100]|nr:hypothetical protein [Acinetobacter sp. NIPH 2100]ENX41166.1 hypothetical protein F887_01562 [Acinetobacter sp. NIPH 2100]